MDALQGKVDSIDSELRGIGDALRSYLDSGETPSRKVKPPGTKAGRDLLQHLLGRLELVVSTELDDFRKLSTVITPPLPAGPDTPLSYGSPVTQQQPSPVAAAIQPPSHPDDEVRHEDPVPPSGPSDPSHATTDIVGPAQPLSLSLSLSSTPLPSPPPSEPRGNPQVSQHASPLFTCSYEDIRLLNEDLFEEFSRHPIVQDRGYFKLDVQDLPPLRVESMAKPTKDHATSFCYKIDSRGLIKVDTGKRVRFSSPRLPFPRSKVSVWSFEQQRELWNSTAMEPPKGTRSYIIGNPLFDDVDLSPGEKLRSRGRTVLEGINTQYVYFNLTGKTITTMHREDAHVRSENLLRSGANKFWCFVKPSSTERLEEQLRLQYPTMRNCSQSVRHLSLHIPPARLDEWGVEYTLDYCVPGQAVVTEPGTYHQVLNLGPNYAIAINVEYNSSPDFPINYTFCDDYCPDKFAMSPEDFVIYPKPLPGTEQESQSRPTPGAREGGSTEEAPEAAPQAAPEPAPEPAPKTQSTAAPGPVFKPASEPAPELVLSEEPVPILQSQPAQLKGKGKSNPKPSKEVSNAPAPPPLPVPTEVVSETLDLAHAGQTQSNSAPSGQLLGASTVQTTKPSRRRRAAPLPKAAKATPLEPPAAVQTAAHPLMQEAEEAMFHAPPLPLPASLSPTKGAPAPPSQDGNRSETLRMERVTASPMAPIPTNVAQVQPLLRQQSSHGQVPSVGPPAFTAKQAQVQVMPVQEAHFQQSYPAGTRQSPPSTLDWNTSYQSPYQSLPRPAGPQNPFKQPQRQHIPPPLPPPPSNYTSDRFTPYSHQTSPTATSPFQQSLFPSPQQNPALYYPGGGFSPKTIKQPVSQHHQISSPPETTPPATSPPYSSATTISPPAPAASSPTTSPPTPFATVPVQQDGYALTAPISSPGSSRPTLAKDVQSTKTTKATRAPKAPKALKEPNVPQGVKRPAGEAPVKRATKKQKTTTAATAPTAATTPSAGTTISPARAVYKNLATLVQRETTRAEALSATFSDPQVFSRAAFERLDQLVKGWRMLALVAPEDRDVYDFINKVDEMSHFNTPIHIFLRRLIRMRLAGFVTDFGAGEDHVAAMNRLLADLKWPDSHRGKLHDYVREGKCWKTICKNEDAYLCIIPLEADVLDLAMFQEPVSRFHSQLNGQFMNGLAQVGRKLQRAIWDRMELAEFAWEGYDTSMLTLKELEPLLARYHILTSKRNHYSIKEFANALRPPGWPEKHPWPVDPTAVRDGERFCNYCKRKRGCQCVKKQIPDVPRVAIDGPKGAGIRSIGRHKQDEVLGELLGDLIAIGSRPNDWTFEVRRPDLNNALVAEIYPGRAGNWVRRVKHSETPTAVFRVEKIAGRWRVLLRTLQEVEDGEEVTAMYGRGFQKVPSATACEVD